MEKWNPWHGCTKISAGCKHCELFSKDARYGRDASQIFMTQSFDLPVKKNRQGEYKLCPTDSVVLTCTTSDFFHPAADSWRTQAWSIIKARSDLEFYITTKRPERFSVGLPDDWHEGYDNVHLIVSCEDQWAVNRRLPILHKVPARHKEISLQPLLGSVNIRKYLKDIELVSCGGETDLSGAARPCDYRWVISVMLQCMENDTPFRFLSTGDLFRKGKKVYHIAKDEQKKQAELAGVDFFSRT